MSSTSQKTSTYQERINSLRETKMLHTREKQELIGSMDYDDWGLILPPPERRKMVKTISASGVPITDCLLEGFEIRSNHPSGGFFGPKSCGENFGRLLKCHPVYIDPASSLAGAYMINFFSCRNPHWNPDFDLTPFNPDIAKYKLLPGIGAPQHFCQDLKIGLDLGFGGLLQKIRRYRQENTPDGADFYDGLEAIVIGLQDWIGRTVVEARRLAGAATSSHLKENLLQIADMNEKLITEPPATFCEACQWILWYQICSRMYNGSGSLGRLDVMLTPCYCRDLAAGILTDEEAVFHIACLLIRDTAYLQLGGPDEKGHDVTNRVSYLVLEAAHRLKIPANIGVCVGEGVDPKLLRRGVEIMFEDKTGMPKFLGVNRTTEGFVRNGYPLETARARAYSGCHWSAIPGREYTLNDCVRINFAAVFEVAWKEMMSDPAAAPGLDNLWNRFADHLGRAVAATARCLDFHMEHYHQVCPELMLDLLCHGPIEKGKDASHGGVEFVNLCLDGAALATVADSFAALEQRVEKEGRLTWQKLQALLDADWAGAEGERARLLLKNIPHYGHGGAQADEWAVRIAQLFTRLVKENQTPAGFNMIPGLFSWAGTIPMGKELGATLNGRHAGAPISHGANPNPGFRKDGAPTAMAIAIASVQPAYGNSAPMQMELDPMIAADAGGIDNIAGLIRTHFDLGGTQINLNIMDAKKVLEAHKDPGKYPDLVVRVTGFSAYFASLSPEFRQLVVDRIITERI